MYVGDDGGNSWALQFESGDNYTSFGKPDPWIAYAHSQGIKGWAPTPLSAATPTTSVSSMPSPGGAS